MDMLGDSFAPANAWPAFGVDPPITTTTTDAFADDGWPADTTAFDEVLPPAAEHYDFYQPPGHLHHHHSPSASRYYPAAPAAAPRADLDAILSSLLP